MLDLVGNPEDRFSHNKAHYSGFSTITCDVGSHNSLIEELHIEPRCEKTGLRGFRPGPTQTRLYSYRRLLEALNFIFRK